MVKSLPANAGDTAWIPGLGRSLEREMAAHSSLLAWDSAWTEEPGGYSPRSCKRGTDLATKQHFIAMILCGI